ncbi:MAG: T9SS type A sorting domain-containing protein, partial [Chitinophagaceae bacterium]
MIHLQQNTRQQNSLHWPPVNRSMTINNPAPGTKYVIGFDVGPAIPFSFTLGTFGPQILTFHFTTLQTSPPPTFGYIYIHFTMPNGQECFEKIEVQLPSCTWTAERLANITTSNNETTKAATGMLVYPNPANQQVMVEYEYGTSTSDAPRHIIIYDMMGKVVSTQTATNVRGTVNVSTSELAAGNYMVRMEESGKTVHRQ